MWNLLWSLCDFHGLGLFLSKGHLNSLSVYIRISKRESSDHCSDRSEFPELRSWLGIVLALSNPSNIFLQCLCCLRSTYSYIAITQQYQNPSHYLCNRLREEALRSGPAETLAELIMDAASASRRDKKQLLRSCESCRASKTKCDPHERPDEKCQR